MKKIFIILVLFVMTYHEQSFCPRGPKHHLKRLNAPKHWMLNHSELFKEYQEREHQEYLQKRMHEIKSSMMEKRRKKKVNQVLCERKACYEEQKSRMIEEHKTEETKQFLRECEYYCSASYLGMIV